LNSDQSAVSELSSQNPAKQLSGGVGTLGIRKQALSGKSVVQTIFDLLGKISSPAARDFLKYAVISSAIIGSVALIENLVMPASSAHQNTIKPICVFENRLTGHYLRVCTNCTEPGILTADGIDYHLPASQFIISGIPGKNSTITIRNRESQLYLSRCLSCKNESPQLSSFEVRVAPLLTDPQLRDLTLWDVQLASVLALQEQSYPMISFKNVHSNKNLRVIQESSASSTVGSVFTDSPLNASTLTTEWIAYVVGVGIVN
jgi:hypothetical protein